MAWRWGPGPILAIELRAAARRWQTYALRAGFLLALLCAFALVGASTTDIVPDAANSLAALGESLYFGLIGTQLTLLLFVAPAATAGALCVDKSRGCLLHILMTDLSGAEIILGKLGARLLPVFSLLLAGVPVLGLATLLGGIEPWTVFGGLAISAGVALFGCALATLLSVWAGKAYEALLAAYAIEVVALLACPAWFIVAELCDMQALTAPVWLWKANPYALAFAPYAWPGSSDAADTLVFAAGAATASAIAVLLAIATVRRVTVRHGTAPARAHRARRLASWRPWPRPSLDGNPVLWREWQRRQPSRWLRGIWTLYWIMTVASVVLNVVLILERSPAYGYLALLTDGPLITIGLLLFSVSAATSLAEERGSGSLDVLLTTPLPVRSIVAGKWWGTFRTVPWLALLPALGVAAMLAFDAEIREAAAFVGCAALLQFLFILAYGATLTSLGLALAIWVARASRAVAWCVTGFVFLTLAPLMAATENGPGNRASWVAAASPLTGLSTDLADAFDPSAASFAGLLGPYLLWIVIYCTVAVVLRSLVVATFDRSLGRVRQRGFRIAARKEA